MANLDTELARTFLEVSRTRHFGRAADNLNLTQSAVSARIRQLEDYLGCQLFTRNRHNIRLTSAGTRLLPHAATMVASWSRARQEVALAERADAFLAIGALPSVWDAFVVARFAQVQAATPGTMYSIEVQGADSLLARLLDGALDLVFLFDAPREEPIVVRKLGSVRLVLVSSERDRVARTVIDEGFVHVDWGAAFSREFARTYPGAPPPATRTNLGSVARDLLRASGGAAYLPREMVTEELRTGVLAVVADAPAMDREVFAAYVDCAHPATSERVLSALTDTEFADSTAPDGMHANVGTVRHDD